MTLKNVTLDDKYTLERGRAYMSGIQALVRLPMLQQERDKTQKLATDLAQVQQAPQERDKAEKLGRAGKGRRPGARPAGPPRPVPDQPKAAPARGRSMPPV